MRILYADVAAYPYRAKSKGIASALPAAKVQGGGRPQKVAHQFKIQRQRLRTKMPQVGKEFELLKHVSE